MRSLTYRTYRTIYRTIRSYYIADLLHIDNKVILYSTGNYIQYPGRNHSRKEYRKNVPMCRTELLILRYTAEINVTM